MSVKGFERGPNFLHCSIVFINDSKNVFVLILKQNWAKKKPEVKRNT